MTRTGFAPPGISSRAYIKAIQTFLKFYITSTEFMIKKNSFISSKGNQQDVLSLVNYFKMSIFDLKTRVFVEQVGSV